MFELQDVKPCVESHAKLAHSVSVHADDSNRQEKYNQSEIGLMLKSLMTF